MQNFLQRFFKLTAAQTTIKIELIAAITSFLTMAYVVMVNPVILGATGMNVEAVFVATCLAAAFGSLLMGLLANYPIGLAPSMGLNAYFAFVVVKQLGYPWEIALGAVFCAGIAFLLLTLVGVRQWLIRMLPPALKVGIGAGIGLFLGVIALQNLHLITVEPHWTFNPAVLTHLPFWLALAGLVLIFILGRYRIHGAILLGIIAVTIIGIILKLTPFQGVFSLPPSIEPTLLALKLPDFTDIKLLMVIFTFFFVALFDNTGTLIAILLQGKFIKSDSSIPRLNQALVADSAATIAGSLLGTSTTGSYIESSAGVKAGGKTGLTAVIIGLLFLLALFFAPLARTVPSFATAPALIYVAILMMQGLRLLRRSDYTEIITALITTLAIPITFSIADGICLGVISYVILNLIIGKVRNIHPALGCLSLIFAAFLLYQHYLM